MPTKTPLQTVVNIICAALCELPSDDRKRAIDAVGETLGVSPSPSPISPSTIVEPRPIVELLADFVRSLRPAQLDIFKQELDMSQKIVIGELAGRVMPPQAAG